MCYGFQSFIHDLLSIRSDRNLQALSTAFWTSGVRPHWTVSGIYPAWVPLVGGSDFQFFRPVFNIADSSISIGIFSILFFYRKLFNHLDLKEEVAHPEESYPDEEQKIIATENESKEIWLFYLLNMDGFSKLALRKNMFWLKFWKPNWFIIIRNF